MRLVAWPYNLKQPGYTTKDYD